MFVRARMKANEIKRFVEREIEPIIDATGAIYYRCAAFLRDGLYLPCGCEESAAAT